MDRQTLPLVIVCVLLIVLWGPLWNWLWPEKPIPPSSSSYGSNQVARTEGVTNTLTTQASPEIKWKSILPELETASSVSTQITALENEDFVVEFSNRGGGIERIKLKKHFENKTDPILLNAHGPLPMMAMAVGDAAFDASYHGIGSSNQLTATYQSPEGLFISKEYTLKPNYQIQTILTLKNTTKSALSNLVLEASVGMAEPLNDRDTGDYIGLSYLSEENPFHETLAGLRKQTEKQGKPFSKAQPIRWAAVKNQYFTQLLTPQFPFAAIKAEPYSLPAHETLHAMKNPHGVLAIIDSAPFHLDAGGSTNFVLNLYAGPKEYKTLSSLGNKQDEVLDFRVMGLEIFGILTKALLWLMSIFHSVFHNWGLAIIGVTVLIKIVFWPLTAMSTRNMKHMQALAPQMNSLKEKHKSDPKKLNEEMMKMYREYKINPMAGCLPMLIQIPIFFAFYSLLRGSIELRGAPFIFWIQDLSASDTIAHLPGLNYAINPLPLIMAATMIWQTKITPQAPNADPSMKIMMWMMPAVFLFTCYNFSSGLSLYWTVQNLLTILQTYYTKDKPVKPPQKVKAKGGFTFGRPIDTKKK